MNEFTNEFVLGDKNVILPEELARASLGLARDIAPYDTGNLADAIYMRRGFSKAKEYIITYPFALVNYLYFLEFGTEKVQMHEKFIRENTVNSIVSLIEMYFNNNFKVKELISGTTFQSIANRKGHGQSRVAVGFTRHKFATTRTRMQRRKKSLSLYNKFYYAKFT